MYVYICAFSYCSVAQLCLTFCNPMDCSMSDFPVLHYLPEFAQTHALWVRGAIQPSHPLSPPSLPALSLSQNQSFPVSQLFALSGQRFMCMYMFVFILLSLIIVKYALWCLAHLPQPQPIDKSLLIAKRDLVQQRKSTIATRKSAQNLFPAEDESGKAWNKKAQRPAWSHGNLFLELQLVCARTCEPKVCVLWALIISMFTFETLSFMFLLFHLYEFPPKLYNLFCEKVLNSLCTA